MSNNHTLMYIPISMVPAVQSIMPRPNGDPATHVVVPREVVQLAPTTTENKS